MPDIIQVVGGQKQLSHVLPRNWEETHLNVISVVATDPNADPHEFETNTADALDFAHANYVNLNGATTDTWGQKLLAADPSNGRKVLNVAEFTGEDRGQ